MPVNVPTHKEFEEVKKSIDGFDMPPEVRQALIILLNYLVEQLREMEAHVS